MTPTAEFSAESAICSVLCKFPMLRSNVSVEDCAAWFRTSAAVPDGLSEGVLIERPEASSISAVFSCCFRPLRPERTSGMMLELTRTVMLGTYHVDGCLKQQSDDACHPRSGRVCVLKLDQIRSFLIERNSGDRTLLVLQLLNKQLFAGKAGRGIGCVVAYLEDNSGIVVDGILPRDDVLGLQIRQGRGVGVVPGRAVSARCDEIGIADGDSEIDGRAGNAGWRNENISARFAIQIEACRILRIHRVCDSRRQSIETRLQRGNLLIAQLNIAGQIASGDRRSNVFALREHILKSGGGIGLRREFEALVANDERRASRRGEREARAIGLNRLHVNQLRELVSCDRFQTCSII